MVAAPITPRRFRGSLPNPSPFAEQAALSSAQGSPKPQSKPRGSALPRVSTAFAPRQRGFTFVVLLRTGRTAGEGIPPRILPARGNCRCLGGDPEAGGR